jgi:serine/threonine protein kinase
VEPAEFKSFGILKRAGVAEFAIRHKMTMAGIEATEIDRFFAPQEDQEDEDEEEQPVMEASDDMYLSSDEDDEGDAGGDAGVIVAAKIFKHARQGVGAGTPPPLVVDNFVQELTVLATIAAPSKDNSLHPNLLRFFGASFTPQLCLLTEHLPMGSLHDYMCKEDGWLWANTVGPAVRVRLAAEAVAGLAHMHSVGVMHRDVKGHNVLLHGSGGGSNGQNDALSLKIADFGSAKIFSRAGGDDGDSKHRAFTVLGTSGYTAPEVYENEGDGYTYSADVWSLGVLVAELMHDVRCTSAAATPSSTLVNPLVGVEATVYYEALKGGTRVPLPQTSCLEKLSVTTSAPAYAGSTTSIATHSTAHVEMANLIDECWAWVPEDRPDYGRIGDILAQLQTSGQEQP